MAAQTQRAVLESSECAQRCKRAAQTQHAVLESSECAQRCTRVSLRRRKRGSWVAAVACGRCRPARRARTVRLAMAALRRPAELRLRIMHEAHLPRPLVTVHVRSRAPRSHGRSRPPGEVASHGRSSVACGCHLLGLRSIRSFVSLGFSYSYTLYKTNLFIIGYSCCDREKQMSDPDKNAIISPKP